MKIGTRQIPANPLMLTYKVLRWLWRGLISRLRALRAAMIELIVLNGTPRLRRFREGEIQKQASAFQIKPRFSILMPVHKVPVIYLRKALESVFAQSYADFEICVVDDGSNSSEISDYLTSIKDPRLKVLNLLQSSGIAGATNKALEMAQGDFIALMDHDDEIRWDALHQLAKAAQDPDVDLIYSDEDKLTPGGRHYMPFFKPDYSPDLLLSHNYFCHLLALRRSLVLELGGLRLGFDGAQDYDLVLRATEKARKIRHIPEILYHWRSIPGSTALATGEKSYAHQAGKRALREALERRKISAEVQEIGLPTAFRVQRKILGSPLVSIVIPFKDQPELLKACLNSILKLSTYKNFEVIGMSNNSSQAETFESMRCYSQQDSRIQFHEWNRPFNFSEIVNEGVRRSRGEHVILLNNDIEVLSPSWIEALLEHSQRPEVGAVGAKLYYPNGQIQHAGVVVGIGGVAGHSHKYYPRDAFGYFSRLRLVSNVAAVTGACVMIKRDLYLSIGGFEESKLRVAFNDVDFCLRLMEKGLWNVWTPFCEAYHHESISRGSEDTPERKLRFQNEVLYMMDRHAAILQSGDPFYSPRLSLKKENFQPRFLD